LPLLVRWINTSRGLSSAVRAACGVSPARRKAIAQTRKTRDMRGLLERRRLSPPSLWEGKPSDYQEAIPRTRQHGSTWTWVGLARSGGVRKESLRFERLQLCQFLGRGLLLADLATQFRLPLPPQFFCVGAGLLGIGTAVLGSHLPKSEFSKGR